MVALNPEKIANLRQHATSQPDKIIAHYCRQRAYDQHRQADLALDLTPATVAISKNNLGKLVVELTDLLLERSPEGSLLQVKGHAQYDVYKLRLESSGYVPANDDLPMHLGLRLARRIVELHGGEMTHETTPNQHYFEICLPLANDAAS
ncbi:MAG: hypothetical protein D6675_11190 [Gemmatimonadetes bacterium]|nr:MAG: hypothetical protein D6675_11190 [Gemmatimonadota bacterium]